MGNKDSRESTRDSFNLPSSQLFGILMVHCLPPPSTTYFLVSIDPCGPGWPGHPIVGINGAIGRVSGEQYPVSPADQQWPSFFAQQK